MATKIEIGRIEIMGSRLELRKIVGICISIFWVYSIVIAGSAYTFIDSLKKEVDYEGTSYHLLIDSDATCSVSLGASWITVLPIKGTGKTDLVITVSMNATSVERVGAVVVGEQTHTLIQRACVKGGDSSNVAAPLHLLAKPQNLAYTVAGSESVAPTPVLRQSIAQDSQPNNGDTFRLDNSFAVLMESDGGFVSKVAATADGGFLVGGWFSSIGGESHFGLAKLKADGTVDPDFNNKKGFDNEIFALAVQPDGKIIVGGRFKTYNGMACAGLVRLNADGSVDEDSKIGEGFNGAVYQIALQADGRILVMGGFSRFKGSNCECFVRLNADGSLDMSFNLGVEVTGERSVMALQADGRIIVASDVVVNRLNTDGTLDTTFHTNLDRYSGEISCLIVQTNGGIILGGDYADYSSNSYVRVVRLNANGMVDPTFYAGNGWFQLPVSCFAMQADGRILFGGDFSGHIGRMNLDNSADTTFRTGGGFSGHVSCLAVQADGRVLVGGTFAAYDGNPAAQLALLSPTGALGQLSIGNMRSLCTPVTKPLLDGKILSVGAFNWINGVPRNSLARLNVDGTLDTTFDPGSGVNGAIRTFAVQPDGRIFVSGDFTALDDTVRPGIARVNVDGSLDSTFNPNLAPGTRIYALALQTDGRIVIVSSPEYAFRSSVIRLNADGSLDSSFIIYSGLNNSASSLAIQSDGKVLAGGLFSGGLIRLNSDGTLDTTFNPGSGFNRWVASLAILDDGRIMAGGSFTSYNNSPCNVIACLNANGTLDTTFNNDQPYTRNDLVRSFDVQKDGRILICGRIRGVDQTIARLNKDGREDESFNIVDQTGSILSAKIMDDGRLLVTGGRVIGSAMQTGIVLLKPDMEPVFLTQPQGARLNIGGSVILTATASGTPEPTFQWYKGGGLLTGQTGSTLKLSNVGYADAGDYIVVATNCAGAATSTVAVVVVTSADVDGPPQSLHRGTLSGGGGALNVWSLAALGLVVSTRFVLHLRSRKGKSEGVPCQCKNTRRPPFRTRRAG